MACSEALADRIRRRLGSGRQVTERKMFGAIGFLLRGHMCVGVWGEALIARVGPEAYDAALREPNVGAFDVTGRPMTGWVLVAAEGVADDARLHAWIDRAAAFVATLPAK